MDFALQLGVHLLWISLLPIIAAIKILGNLIFMSTFLLEVISLLNKILKISENLYSTASHSN